jgi:hypothetical protein
MAYNNDYIFQKNMEIVLKNLVDKNIIHKTQYIADEETQIDGDGPESSWQIIVLCIEKTDDDYIYHLFQSEYLHSYSYPSLKVVDKFNLFSQKLSQIKEIGISIYNKPSNEINNYIRMFNDHYSAGFQSNDQDLIKDLKSLSLQIDDLEIILDDLYKKERIKRDKQYEEYLKSDEYKQYLQIDKEYKDKIAEENRKSEEARLKLWVDKYGEEKGTQYFNRL